MHGRLLALALMTGSLSTLLIPEGLNPQSFALGISLQKKPDKLSLENLSHLAESITVKVRSEEILGSGIIIHQQEKVYTVLTNDHVVRAATPPYRIQTLDDQVYEATLIEYVCFENNDLALLTFQSSQISYNVARLGSPPNVGETVFAAGFPFAYEPLRTQGFVFNMGQVSILLDKSLEGGYQVGYTNDIGKGMSGGPLLNRQGELVGINGMHADPLWGDPYVFSDGSFPEANLREQMSQYSWGISIDTFRQLAPEEFIVVP